MLVCVAVLTQLQIVFSLPTVTRNECHELSTCIKNWDLYEENKILKK